VLQNVKGLSDDRQSWPTCGRGLVAKENQPMKSLNHDTRHLSRHDSDEKNDRRWGRWCFYVALFFDCETT